MKKDIQMHILELQVANLEVKELAYQMIINNLKHQIEMDKICRELKSDVESLFK